MQNAQNPFKQRTLGISVEGGTIFFKTTQCAHARTLFMPTEDYGICVGCFLSTMQRYGAFLDETRISLFRLLSLLTHFFGIFLYAYEGKSGIQFVLFRFFM